MSKTSQFLFEKDDDRVANKKLLSTMGCGRGLLDNARAGLKLPTATNHFDRVQSIQMPRTKLYAKAKRFFSAMLCPCKVLQTKQGMYTLCTLTHTHSGTNCTMGTEARAENNKNSKVEEQKNCANAQQHVKQL